MTFLIILLAVLFTWYGIGWLIVVTQGLISSETGKSIISNIEKLADKSEKISPYLALVIIFGPIGILLKKSLYGNE